MKKYFYSLLFTAILFGCAEKKPLTKENEKFAGYWTSLDGSSIVNIASDGSGDCLRLLRDEKTSSKSSLESAAVYINNDTILFTIMGIKEQYRIDQFPGTETNDIMVLDKVTYNKVSAAKSMVSF
jgi:hypothetical protein